MCPAMAARPGVLVYIQVQIRANVNAVDDDSYVALCTYGYRYNADLWNGVKYRELRSTSVK